MELKCRTCAHRKKLKTRELLGGLHSRNHQWCRKSGLDHADKPVCIEKDWPACGRYREK